MSTKSYSHNHPGVPNYINGITYPGNAIYFNGVTRINEAEVSLKQILQTIHSANPDEAEYIHSFRFIQDCADEARDSCYYIQNSNINDSWAYGSMEAVEFEEIQQKIDNAECNVGKSPDFKILTFILKYLHGPFYSSIYKLFNSFVHSCFDDIIDENEKAFSEGLFEDIS